MLKELCNIAKVEKVFSLPIEDGDCPTIVYSGLNRNDHEPYEPSLSK